MSNLSHNVKAMRDAVGLSQEGLARKADVPLHTVARTEQGRVAPRIDAIAKIAAALDTTVDALLAEAS